LWGAENPIGGQINALGRTFTVIGVVGDSRSTSLKAAPARMIYVHYVYRTPGQTFFIARGTHGADTLPALMRQVISAQSPHVFVARTKTLNAQLNDSLARERFQTFVLIAFGASALLLAVLGIYGVLSYSVAARKQEIGLRMALGASRSSVYALTMLEAGFPVAGGLAAGLAVSFWIVRLIDKFLYGAKAVDLPVIASVVLLFATAATAAAFFPARHAASVNPMDALRPD
jgi:ABC-type antimicrobial peptide transport system permease subunit